MIPVALFIFGVLSFSLISVLVGFLGARREIGFGWSFLISVITTPLIGLIVTLLFDKLPVGERKWGCLGSFLAILVIAVLSILLFGIIVSAA